MKNLLLAASLLLAACDSPDRNDSSVPTDARPDSIVIDSGPDAEDAGPDAIEDASVDAPADVAEDHVDVIIFQDPPPPDTGMQDADTRCIDMDNDGFGDGPGCPGTDCNDGDPEIRPPATERCSSVDYNCDGVTGLGLPTAGDSYCRDTFSEPNPSQYSSAPGRCIGPATPIRDEYVNYRASTVPTCMACRFDPQPGGGTMQVCVCWDVRGISRLCP